METDDSAAEVLNEVSFTVNPRVLGDAIEECRRDLEVADQAMYIAAAKPDTNLYMKQKCGPEDAADDSAGRVIIGLEGTGRSYAFADIPAQKIEAEGVFLIRKIDELSAWTDEADDYTTITYKRVPKESGSSDERTIRLDYPSGYDMLTIPMYYPQGSFNHIFQAHTDRFSTPRTELQSEELAGMLSLAKKIAPTGKSADRSGDLVIKTDRSGEELDITAEFISLKQFKRAFAAMQQRVKLSPTFPIEDLEWEMEGRHLSLMERILTNDTAKGEIFVENQGEEEEQKLLCLAYEKDGPAGSTIYYHRQLGIRRENDPIKKWGDDALQQENCKLFAATYSETLIKALRKTWALKQKEIIEAKPDVVDGSDRLRLATYSGDTERDEKLVPCTPGDSEIDGYYFMPPTLQDMERIIGSDQFLQIRSWPIQGEERSNAYVIAPVPESAEDHTDRIDPDRIMIVTWPGM